MACIENMPPAKVESDMEEGEIVDEYDDLSDISSEEEFLLRQRLQVLENYNNVLERKKFKSSLGKNYKRKDPFLKDLSDISASDFEDHNGPVYKNFKVKCITVHSKPKRKKEPALVRDKKKPHRNKKKFIKVKNESSEESEDEYKNKRQKLLDAVSVNIEKSDTSSLKARLNKMLFYSQTNEVIKPLIKENTIQKDEPHNGSLMITKDSDISKLIIGIQSEKEVSVNTPEMCDLINICNGNDVQNESSVCVQDCIDSGVDDKNEVENIKIVPGDSDEDLELLRQHALKTKTLKHTIETENNVENIESKPMIMSEDEDSDTAELRLICLKSAFLKKAIEMKQKQKLKKRQSQSFNDNFAIDTLSGNAAENNTDTESMDMDIGSDGDDKLKDIEVIKSNFGQNNNILKDIQDHISAKEEEVEEDEDLLRAKLLTSLSKNLPLVDTKKFIVGVDSSKELNEGSKPKSTIKPEEKQFIIKLGESDSEGEHEATKNLTKMHMKLSEQIDFQHKLDLFLKSTRMEVEKTSLPDVVHNPAEQLKSTPKFVAKAVRHLPKSEQIEYKNLVKRMEELEKLKQTRLALVNQNKTVLVKDTLKPRNIPVETTMNTIKKNNLEVQIAFSRKKIAEVSAKMLKLKEEATKLSQKYKIAATELRNITTAMTLNKKGQRFIQNKLSKIRLQHQLLLKSSTTNNHSKPNLPIINRMSNKLQASNKLQKENNPSKEEHKNLHILKSVKVSVVNDFKEDSTPNSKLSVQIDVSNNKKAVKMPKGLIKERIVTDMLTEKNKSENVLERNKSSNPVMLKGEEGAPKIIHVSEHVGSRDDDDYKSPLVALQTETWVEDPNIFLCPFEVGGNCRDPECKNLHPKIPKKP